jgi:SWI/SNF-related matrix-associated actin-dependent regulator of chromatin subfamily D
LVAMGKAHCQIAELQETFAKEFHETLIEPLEKFRDEFREYEQLRKKLESRRCVPRQVLSASAYSLVSYRLTLDAALSKTEKVKKEKDKKDAEEELMKARLR